MANIIFTPNQNAWVSPEFFANLYKQRHDLIEKEESDLAQREDVLTTIQAMLNENVDTEAINNIKLFKDEISKISNDLTSGRVGIKNTKNRSKELWREAIPILKTYEQGIKNREKRQKEISDLEKRGYRVFNTLSDISEYANMDESSLYYYNPEEYINAGANFMKQYNSNQPISYNVKNSNVPGYKILKSSQGLIEVPTEGDVYDYLLNNAKTYIGTKLGLDTNNYNNWNTMQKEMVNTYMQGLSKGIIAPEYQLVEDPKAKKEMSDLALWTAQNNYNNSRDNYNNTNPFTGLFNLGVIYTNSDNSIYEGPISNASQVNDLFSTKVAKLANTLDKNNIEQYLTEEGREYYEKNENNDDVFTDLIENMDSYLNKSFYRDQTKGAIELEELEKLIKDPNVGIFINDDGTYNVYNKISTSVDKMQNNLIAGALEGVVDNNNVTEETRSGQYIMDNNFSNLLNNNVKNIKSLTSEIIKRYNKLSTKNISEDNIKIDYDSNKQRFTLNIGEGVNLKELNNALRSFKNKDYLKE